MLLAGNSLGEVHAWCARSCAYLWGFSPQRAPRRGGGSACAAPHSFGFAACRDAVRRMEAVGPSLFLCMRSGECHFLHLDKATLPGLGGEWERAAAVGEEQLLLLHAARR